jgi:hypothetical protein
MVQSTRDFLMVLVGAGVYALVREVGWRVIYALWQKAKQKAQQVEQKAEDAIKKL